MYKLLLRISLMLLGVNIAFATNATKEENTADFQPFTGKVIGSKVRLRLEPDLNAHIISEMKKKDLLLVVGEENDFWAVQPPSNIKVFVFRSYVLDNTIEAQRVNIRLSPDLGSPVVCQLHGGDRIEGKVSEKDRKWFEITPPKKVKFYVSKEFLSNAGDRNYITTMEKRKEEVEKLLNSAFYITQEECKKNFDQMQPQIAVAQFEGIIQGYSEFEEHVQQAKEGLVLIQDTYLQKKIAYLEERNELTEELKTQLFSEMSNIEKKTDENNFTDDPKGPSKMEPSLWGERSKVNTTSWKEVEKDLFISWNSYHPEKNMKDFYKEQEVNSDILEGVIEAFAYDIKNKPGDYILYNENTKLPTALLYSTHIDLEEFIGKSVSLKASPRPNNSFAFPAYFVNFINN